MNNRNTSTPDMQITKCPVKGGSEKEGERARARIAVFLPVSRSPARTDPRSFEADGPQREAEQRIVRDREVIVAAP